MLTTREVRGVRVCRAPKPGKELTKDGLPRRGRKIGKVSKTVFDPSGMPRGGLHRPPSRPALDVQAF